MTQPTYTDDFLPEKKPSNTIYLSIYEGKLCQRRGRPAAGFREYISQNPKSEGKISYIKEFDHIEGYVTGFERKERETLDKKKYMVARITFTSPSGREAILETGIRNDFVARFAKCCENIDFQKRLYIRAFAEPGTANTGIMFKQDGEKIAQKYTVENPNGLPQWEKDPISGDWDTREYWKFLFNIIASKIPEFERVKQLLADYQEQPVVDDNGNGSHVEEEHEDAAVPSEYTDDIPF